MNIMTPCQNRVNAKFYGLSSEKAYTYNLYPIYDISDT